MTARSLLYPLLFGVSIAAGPSAARAEIILDDFNDPAQVASPAMLNEFVHTPNVGVLDATRSIRIAAGQSNPRGQITIDGNGSSSYVATLSELNANDVPQMKIVSVQGDYQFNSSANLSRTDDVTEGGTNNAVFFDFNALTSDIAPQYLHLLVSDLTSPTSYDAFFAPLPLVHRPFTLVVPFSDFHVRAGSIGSPDFDALVSFDFSLRVVRGSAPQNLNFRMDLDRIRFGRIPEPPGDAIAVLGLSILAAACAVRSPSSFAEGVRRWRFKARTCGRA